jgi:CubicO group peptidase (beta-lactamase class C family)
VNIKLFILNLLIISALRIVAQPINLYFPPNVGTTWATTAPATLGWCQPSIDSLTNFLAESHTKSFIILKDGKIVLEKYFGTFTQDSIWYWASAGKSLTAVLIGIAQQQNLLDIDQKTSDFLGTGWTSCTPTQEANIKIRHQLSMTTGLDDTPTGTIDPNNCTDAACLQYLAEPDTRWAYHTGAYRLLQNVIAKSANLANINLYNKANLLDKIGAKGIYANGVFFSRTRDMARFGLFLHAKGGWNGTQIMTDMDYFTQMTTPSQDLNKSYGYLFWLNGQQSFMLPTLQLVFPTQLVTAAPADLLMCLGKNDQKIHVSPSKGLVVIRMGDTADGGASDVPVTFDQQLWEKINALDCSLATQVVDNEQVTQISPNPTSGEFSIHNNDWTKVILLDCNGREVRSFSKKEILRTDGLRDHFFLVKIIGENGRLEFRKLIKIK